MNTVAEQFKEEHPTMYAFLKVDRKLEDEDYKSFEDIGRQRVRVVVDKGIQVGDSTEEIFEMYATRMCVRILTQAPRAVFDDVESRRLCNLPEEHSWENLPPYEWHKAEFACLRWIAGEYDKVEEYLQSESVPGVCRFIHWLLSRYPEHLSDLFSRMFFLGAEGFTEEECIAAYEKIKSDIQRAAYDLPEDDAIALMQKVAKTDEFGLTRGLAPVTPNDGQPFSVFVEKFGEAFLHRLHSAGGVR